MPPDPESLERIRRLEGDLLRARGEAEEFRRHVSEHKAALRDRDREVGELRTNAGRLSQEILDLKRQLEESRAARPSAKVDDIARHLRSVVTVLEAEAREDNRAGKPSVLVEALEIEIRGGITLKDGVHITELLPQEIRPESVSKMRIALRPLTTIKIADET